MNLLGNNHGTLIQVHYAIFQDVVGAYLSQLGVRTAKSMKKNTD